MAERNFINFHNEFEKNLFDYELSGQISDGLYENSSPDWDYWCRLETRVGTPIGRTESLDYSRICKKDNYSFRNLYDYVGNRMESILRLTAAGLPEQFLNYAWRFEDFPTYLGEYDPQTHKETKNGGVNPYFNRSLNDEELKLFEYLENKYGEEEMYNKWNRLYVPTYKETLKGIRQCMKTVLNQKEIEEIKESQLTQKKTSGAPLTKEEAKEELKKHIVMTIRDKGKIRVMADDGKHGKGFVSFPNKLRTSENLFFYVENGLRWNGKNYLATEKDGIREATKEEVKILFLK